jgi:NADH:ubiquinone oxidoreductase subunit 2 (subunit N)
MFSVDLTTASINGNEACPPQVIIFTLSILEILLGLELISLSSYIIASSYKNTKRNYMGVIKYMIMSSISSAIIIIGIAQKIGITLLTIGLVYKLGVIGNHN